MFSLPNQRAAPHGGNVACENTRTGAVPPPEVSADVRPTKNQHQVVRLEEFMAGKCKECGAKRPVLFARMRGWHAGRFYLNVPGLPPVDRVDWTCPKCVDRARDAKSMENTFSGDLLRSAEYGDLSGVQQALAAGADLNFRNDEGRSALTIASMSGNLDVVAFLLARRADVSARDHSGWTALLGASASGRYEVVELLLDNGADINATDETGWTPLMWACSGGGDSSTAKLLIHRGARVDATGTNGLTAFDLASQSHQGDVLRLLKSGPQR